MTVGAQQLVELDRLNNSDYVPVRLGGTGAITFDTGGIVVSSGGTAALSATNSPVITGPLTAAAFIPTGATIPVNGMYLPATNTVGFSTNSTLRMSIDSTGNIIFQKQIFSALVSDYVAGGFPTPAASIVLVANSISTPNANVLAARFSTDNASTIFAFVKGRGTAAAATAVVLDDYIFDLRANGVTGAGTLALAASMAAQVDGAVSGAIVPGRITFATMNAAGTLAERMRIDSAGIMWVGDPSAYTFTAPTNASFSNDATGINVLVRKSITANSWANISYVRTRGTAAAPTAVVSGDGVGANTYYAHDGTSYSALAQLLVDVDGAVSAGIVPGRMLWRTANAAGVITERMRIASDGVITLGAAPGSESFRVQPVASAVNYWRADGNVTTGPPVLYAWGSDTNVTGAISSKGTGSVTIYTGSAARVVATFLNIASSVNYWQFAPNATGGSPTISPAGSDTNIGMSHSSKGAGVISFFSDGFANTTFGIRRSTAADTAYISTLTSTAMAFIEVMGSAADASLSLVSKKDGNINLYSGGGVALKTLATFGNVASSVNYFVFYPSATGNRLAVNAVGTDTNVGINYQAKGTGSHIFLSHGGANVALSIGAVASSVNYVEITPAATSGYPTVFFTGSDAYVFARYATKGTADHFFYTDTNSVQFRIGHTAGTIVNYPKVYGATTGGFATYTVEGETNVGLNIISKGSSNIHIVTGGTGGIVCYTNNNLPQLAIVHVASAVNYVTIQGAATGNTPALYSAGTDANIPFAISSKGTGSVSIDTGTFGRLVAQFLDVASSVNYLVVSPSATGNPIILQAAGSDTNIGINYTAKGTGIHLFNAPVRTSTHTVAGLPAGTQGDRAFVSDALAPVFGAAVAGGGAVKVPVYYTGAAWFVG
jgi:hypothetical protein